MKRKNLNQPVLEKKTLTVSLKSTKQMFLNKCVYKYSIIDWRQVIRIIYEKIIVHIYQHIMVRIFLLL